MLDFRVKKGKILQKNPREKSQIPRCILQENQNYATNSANQEVDFVKQCCVQSQTIKKQWPLPRKGCYRIKNCQI